MRAMANRPKAMIAFFGVITLLSWAAILWGLQEPGVLTATENSRGGIAIGVGLVPGIIAPGVMLIYLRMHRAARRIDRGDHVIARWRVTASELAEFKANDEARNALGGDYRNEWAVPKRQLEKGIDIAFAADGVRVGDAYYPLVNTGGSKFAGVQMLPMSPLAIEFGIITTYVSGDRFRRSQSVLRLPVSRVARAEAITVLEHFKRVDAREIVVNPDFYDSRIRWGLRLAPIFFAMFLIGLWINAGRTWRPDEEGWGPMVATMTLTIAGCLFGIGALIVAVAAWWLKRGQMRR